jgi:hypothetical protein
MVNNRGWHHPNISGFAVTVVIFLGYLENNRPTAVQYWESEGLRCGQCCYNIIVVV